MFMSRGVRVASENTEHPVQFEFRVNTENDQGIQL